MIKRQSVSFLERAKMFFKKTIEKLPEDERFYFKEKLLCIEEAPEPNDVNWEFICIPTIKKIKVRIIINLLFYLLLGSCCGIIWVITYFQSQSLEHAYENKEKSEDEFSRIKTISILVSAMIVCFNKFCLGRMIHFLVE